MIFPVFYLMLRPKPMETPCKKLKIPLAPADKIRYNAVGIENDFQYQAKGFWGTGEMAQPANISTVEEESEELVTLDTGGARAPRKIILIGQPNVGKSLLFTNLTSHYVTISNYPGTTVEFAQGRMKIGEERPMVIDVPGTYTLEPTCKAEEVAVQMLKEGDLVINIVDATNLERNLYLAVQIMEMGAPLIIALNMMDEAESRRYTIDIEAISQEMGVSVIPMVANRNKGTDELMEEIVRVAERKTEASGVRIEYGREVENEISRLEEAMLWSPLASKYSPKWLAVKLIEGDEEIIKKFEEAKSG